MFPHTAFNCPHCGAPGLVNMGQAEYSCVCRFNGKPQEGETTAATSGSAVSQIEDAGSPPPAWQFEPTVDEDGDVLLEWYLNKSNVVTLSFGASGFCWSMILEGQAHSGKHTPIKAVVNRHVTKAETAKIEKNVCICTPPESGKDWMMVSTSNPMCPVHGGIMQNANSQAQSASSA